MNYSNELYSWMLNFIFVTGILLVPVGLAFILIPEMIFKMATKLNRWITTDGFFNKLNVPVYKERFFYRHHQAFGLLVMSLSCFCIYMLTSYIGIASVMDYLFKLAETEFEKWLFIILYYLLIAAIVLAFFFSFIMFIRPSLLKSFEAWANHWVDTDRHLKMLDKNKDLPDKILFGNPRFFGFIVTIAGIYIIWNTNQL